VKRHDTLMKRLAAYSATAGAAMIVVPVTEAAIQNVTAFSYDGGNTFTTTPPDVTGNPPNSSHSLGFTAATANHAIGAFGSLIAGRFSGPANSGFAGIWASNPSFAATYNGNKVRNLSFNAPIAGATNFVNGALTLANKGMTYSGSPFNTGSFVPSGNNAVKTGYIGFRYGGSSHTYYGWLRVKVVNDGSGLPFEVTLADKNGDGIYGAFGLPSDNIKAGEVASVPEPSVGTIGGLGLLALGAAGVRELRRRRGQSKIHN